MPLQRRKQTPTATVSSNQEDEYTFDMAKRDPELIGSVRRYARNVEDKVFKDDNEAFDWFVNDRRWKDSNSLSALKELNYVKGGWGDKYASQQDLKDLMTIKSKWDKMPNMFEQAADGNIGAAGEALVSNVAKGFVDPLMAVGGPLAGKVASKFGAKIIGKTIASAATDAVATAGINVATQDVNKSVGLQQDTDWKEVLLAGAIGGVVSAPGHALANKTPNKDVFSDPAWAAKAARGGSDRLEKEGFDRKLGLMGDKQTIKLPDDTKLNREEILKTGGPDTSDPSMVDLTYEATNTQNVSPEQLTELQNQSRYSKGLVEQAKSLYGSKWYDEYVATENNVKKFIQDQWQIIENPEDFEKIVPRMFSPQGPKGSLLSGRGVIPDALALKRAKQGNAAETLEEQATNMINRPAGQLDTVEGSFKNQMTLNALESEWKRVNKQIANKPDNELTEAEIKYRDFLSTAMPAAQLSFRGMKSEAGRLMRSFQDRYAPTTMADVFKKTGKMIDPITKQPVSKDEWMRVQKDISKAAMSLDDGDALQLDLFVNNLQKANNTDMFKEVWYNSLLSNPSTHVINGIGNGMIGGINAVEKRWANTATGQNMGTLPWRMKGYADAWREAWKVGVRAWKTEIPTDPRTRLEMDHSAAVPSFTKDPTSGDWRRAGMGEGGWGGRQIRAFGGRPLLAIDEMSKMIHYRAALRDSAARRINEEYKAQGIKVDTADLMRRVDESVKNPSDADMNFAREEARRLTLQDDPGQMTQNVQGIIDGMNVGDIPVGRMIIPFLRTPVNILRQSGDMLGMTKRTRDDWAAGGYRREQAKARVVLGYGLMATTTALASAGYITGPAPTDPAARNAWEANDMQAWSIRIPGSNQWVQYNRLDPVATPMALAAGIPEIFKAMNDPTREQAFMETIVGLLSDAFLDKTWFQGVQSVVEAANEPERKLGVLGKGLVRSFVPAIVAGVGRAYDPRVTAPKTFAEVIQDRIGFEQKTKVPSKVDALGNDVGVEVAGTGQGDDGVVSAINRFINPFRAKTITNDPVKEELKDLRVKISKPPNKWKGIELNAEQYYIYSKAKGKYINDLMRFAQTSPAWKRMADPEKRMIIDKFKTEAGQVADIMLIGTYPELYAMSKDPKHDTQLKNLLGPRESDLKKKGMLPSIKRGFGAGATN